MTSITHSRQDDVTSRTSSIRRRIRLFAVVAASTLGVALPSAAQAFNPQPDPPRSPISVHPAFNPQPDPPGRV